MVATTRSAGFQVGGEATDLFRSAARFYAGFRRPYPPQVVSHLVEHFQLDGRGRLLDGGCGTGQVFQVMAPYFAEVLAFDADPDMVRYAKATARKLELSNVRVILLSGEQISEALGQFRMAIFGASFHWMDRVFVGNLVYDRLEPGGHLVVLSPGGIHSGTTDWEAEIRAALNQWLGPDRRAGGGVYRSGELHQDALRRTRLSNFAVTDIEVQEEWSLEQIVGYIFSTSYASKNVLGANARGFAQDVRRRLLRLRPDGRFEKVVEYTVISAERAPDGE